ncbi:hypothetical protein ScPMuIL_011346 [Solemya velum]
MNMMRRNRLRACGKAIHRVAALFITPFTKAHKVENKYIVIDGKEEEVVPISEFINTDSKISRWISESARRVAEVGPMNPPSNPAVFQKTPKHIGPLCKDYTIFQLFTKHRKVKDFRVTSGKVAIMTGGTSGIGYEVVKGLVKKDFVVFIGARNLVEGEETVKNIKKEYRDAKVSYLELQLDSLVSIRHFAEKFQSENSSLHLLINNAGAMFLPQNNTRDGFNEQLQVNYLGHFYLSYLLFDILQESSDEEYTRIVNVSSAVHYLGCPDVEVIFKKSDRVTRYSPHASYSNSKLAIVMSSFELDERLQRKEKRIVVNCLHPGIVRTQLYKHVHWSIKWFLDIIAYYTYMSPEEGSDTVLHVALSPDPCRERGGYYDNCQKKDPNPAALSETLRTDLWIRSCEELNIPPDWI